MPDFLKYKGSNYQIVYVDNSLISGSNDGSSITGALQTFPSTPSLLANSLYLIRRTNYIPITRAVCPQDNVLVVGMPSTSADYFYNNLPLDVVSTWGADSIPTTNIYLDGVANTPWDFGTGPTNSGYGLFNLNLNLPSNQSQSMGAVHFYGTGNTIANCTITVSGQPLSGALNLTSVGNFCSVRVESGEGFTFDRNDVIAYGANNDAPNTDGSSSIALLIKDPTPNINVGTVITNSTFRTVHTGVTASYNVYGLYGRGAYYAGTFKNLNFINLKNNPAQGGYRHFYLNTIMNSCVMQDITGSASPSNSSYYGFGMHIDYGAGGSNDSDQHQHNSKHTFKNIQFYDQAFGVGSFYGMYFSYRFTDCEFSNIKIWSPRASNSTSYSAIYFAQNYNHHNKFDGLDINYGADLIDTPSNSTECYGLNINQDTVINTSKNYLSNSTIRCSRVAVNASNLDVKNCSITGSMWVSGDAIELNTLEVNPNAFKFATQGAIFKFKYDGTPQYYVPSNNVARIYNFNNISGVNQNIEYNYGLVSVESASGGFAIPLVSQINAYAGKIYLNNYPQSGYWYAANYWHRMESNGVQYVTSDNISGGFSIKTITGVVPGTTYPAQAQSLCISPKPFRGDTVYSSGASLGWHTLTLYCATRFALPVTSKDIWVEVEIPNGPTGTDTKIINTYGSKIVELDTTTTWLGDAPLIRYKLEIPILLERQENIYTRIHWNKSMLVGSSVLAYIAPHLVFR